MMTLIGILSSRNLKELSLVLILPSNLYGLEPLGICEMFQTIQQIAMSSCNLDSWHQSSGTSGAPPHLCNTMCLGMIIALMTRFHYVCLWPLAYTDTAAAQRAILSSASHTAL